MAPNALHQNMIRFLKSGSCCQVGRQYPGAIQSVSFWDTGTEVHFLGECKMVGKSGNVTMYRTKCGINACIVCSFLAYETGTGDQAAAASSRRTHAHHTAQD